MDQAIKRAFWIVLTAAICAIGVGAIWYVSASASQRSGSEPSFSVSAEAKRIALPDVATFTFGVLTEGGKDIAPLQEQNSSKMNAINDFLKKSGIDPKDIETANYDVQPRYSYQSCPMKAGGMLSLGMPCRTSSEIIGYSINQNVRVKIRDFSKIGGVLSEIIDKGANFVSSLAFDVDDPTQLKVDVRAEAIAKARRQAEAMAKAAGFRLGRIVSLYENSGPILYGKGMSGSSVQAMSPSSVPAPSIEPGSEVITSQVTVTYEIR